MDKESYQIKELRTLIETLDKEIISLKTLVYSTRDWCKSNETDIIQLQQDITSLEREFLKRGTA